MSEDRRRTVTGDMIPSPGELILAACGKIDGDHEALKDVRAWDIHPDGRIEVLYNSGREEKYEFTAECVESGIFFGV